MKRKYLFIPGIALSLFIPISFASSNASEALASFDEVQEFSDDFNNKSFNSNWTNKDAEIVSDYSSLRIVPDGQEWGANLVYSKYKVTSDVSKVEVSFDVQQLANYGWLGFSVGQPTTKSPFSSGQYGFIFTNEMTQYFVTQGAAGLKEDTTPEGASSIFTPLSVPYVSRNASFTFTRQSDNTFKLDYIVKDRNGKQIGAKTNITTPNIDGYFSFNAYTSKNELLSFVVKDDHEEAGVLKTVCEEDFSKSTILYASSGTADAEWYANTFTEKDVTCGLIGKAKLAKSGSSLIFNTPFEKSNNEKLNKLYELQATFYLGEMSSEAKTGFEISKESIDSNGLFYGIEKSNSGYYLIASNGDAFNKIKCSFEDGNSEQSVKVNLSVYFDGSIILSDGINSVSGKVNNVNGYFAIKTLGSDGDLLTGGKVDDFSFVKSTYLDRTNSDVGQTFNGTKESFDEYGALYEFFISNHDWHIGPLVRMPIYSTKNANDPYILFSNSSITSAFGPKVKFKDFIARFDVDIQTDCNSASFNGAALGLQVGKKTYEVGYANANSLGLQYYNGICVPLGTQTTLSQTEVDKLSTTNYFKKDTVLNFLFVVRNNKIEMHYKTSDQADSELAEAKISGTYGSTDGYVAVYGANGLSFKLKNLSITNLDYDLKDSTYLGKNYTETIRHDFTKSSNTDGLVLNNSSINNDKLKINEGGSIKTEHKLNGNIVRFRISSIENQLVIKQGNTSVTLDNSQAKKLIIKNLNGSKEIELGRDFIFENSLFELKHCGTKFELRYASGEKPLAFIDSNLIDLDEMLEFSNQEAEIEIISKNGISSLKELSIFNLDNHITIPVRNYDPNIDYFDPWVKREAIQDHGNIQLAWIIPTAVVAGAIVAIATSYIIVYFIGKKRGQKNEK